MQMIFIVIDIGMQKFSKRVYSKNNIISSALNLLKEDLGLLQHGQISCGQLQQLNWALQTLRFGKLPWQLLNESAMFESYNLTSIQKTMAKKEATYTLLSIEENTCITWLLHRVISQPFQFSLS